MGRGFRKVGQLLRRAENLGIKKSECASFVVKLIKLNAQKRDRNDKVLGIAMAGTFIDGFEYLTKDPDGPIW